MAPFRTRACRSRRGIPPQTGTATISGVHVLGFRELGHIRPSRIDAEPSIQVAHHAPWIGDQLLVDQDRDALVAESLQERPQLHRVVADRDELRISPDCFGDRAVFGVVPRHMPVMADCALDQVSQQIDEAGLGIERGDPLRNSPRSGNMV
jgi:hypothetical protein